MGGRQGIFPPFPLGIPVGQVSCAFPGSEHGQVTVTLDGWFHFSLAAWGLKLKSQLLGQTLHASFFFFSTHLALV